MGSPLPIQSLLADSIRYRRECFVRCLSISSPLIRLALGVHVDFIEHSLPPSATLFEVFMSKHNSMYRASRIYNCPPGATAMRFEERRERVEARSGEQLFHACDIAQFLHVESQPTSLSRLSCSGAVVRPFRRPANCSRRAQRRIPRARSLGQIRVESDRSGHLVLEYSSELNSLVPQRMRQRFWSDSQTTNVNPVLGLIAKVPHGPPKDHVRPKD